MCCASCATTASRRASERASAIRSARAACRAAAYLLPSLSAERVAQELTKLLAAADPVPALRMMQVDGVLAAVLPEARRLDRLQRLIEVEPDREPLRRFAALVDIDAADAAALAERSAVFQRLA